MTRRERLIHAIGFDDRWFMLIGIPVVAFSMPFIFFPDMILDGEGPKWIRFGVSLFYCGTIWLAVREIIMRLRLQFPKPDQTRKRIILSTLGILVTYFIIDRIGCAVEEALVPEGKSESAAMLIRYTAAGLVTTVLITSIYEGTFLFFRWKASVLEAEQLRRETVESQLEGLRSQVNPHFLFNSLNTLTYIIPEDPPKAIKFVQKLSKVYRYVLESRSEKLISLEEELRFLDSYVFLLKERFGENLQVDIDIPEVHRSTRIVPLSLQLLFENAIKHNIISADQPLAISLQVDNSHLLMRNKLQRKRQSQPSTGVGLENVRHRYAFFTDRNVVISETDDTFEVHLPLIEAPAAKALVGQP